MQQAGAGGCDPMPPLRIPFPSPPAQSSIGAAAARRDRHGARRGGRGAGHRSRGGADPSWSGTGAGGARRQPSRRPRAGRPRRRSGPGACVIPRRGRRHRRIAARDYSCRCGAAGRGERPPVCANLGQRPGRAQPVGPRGGRAQPGRRGHRGFTGPWMVPSAGGRARGRLRLPVDARRHPAGVSRLASPWDPSRAGSALRLESPGSYR